MSMQAYAYPERQTVTTNAASGLKADGMATLTPAAELPAPRVRLTRKERELLQMLTQNAGRCVSRETLLRTIWQYSEGTKTRTVDVHVQRLRRKLGSAADSLKTIVRQGYCWFPDTESALSAGAF